MDNLPYVFSNV